MNRITTLFSAVFFFVLLQSQLYAKAPSLLMVKAPSIDFTGPYSQVNYTLTAANEGDETAYPVTVVDVMSQLDENGTKIPLDPGIDLNLTFTGTGTFTCLYSGSPDYTITCTGGTVTKNQGNVGLPGIDRIHYTITTPAAPITLFNEANVSAPFDTGDATKKEDNATVRVVSGGASGTVPYTPPPKHADVIDTSRWTDTTTYNASSPGQDSKVLTTKLSGHAGVPLTAVHLDGNGNAIEYDHNQTDLGFIVMPSLSDGYCGSDDLILDSTGNPLTFTIGVGHTTDTQLAFFPKLARQVSRIKLMYLDLGALYDQTGQKCVDTSSKTGNLAELGQCVNSAIKYYAAFGLAAYERCEVRNGMPCESDNHGYSCGPGDTSCPDYNPMYDNPRGCLMCTLNYINDCSTDAFAIRPERFSIDVNDTSPLFVAGVDYALEVNATNAGGVTPAFAYTTTLNNTNNTNSSYVLTPAPATTTCPPVSTETFAISFTDGSASQVSSYMNVGDVNLTFVDGNWTFVDQGKTPAQCIAGSDRNDTNPVGCLVGGSMAKRFIPHHFEIDAQLSDRGNGFTYLSDFETNPGDLNMSSTLDINVSAAAKDGTTTTHYIAGCYAKITNVDINVTPITFSPANALSKILYHVKTNTTTMTGNTALGTPFTGFTVMNTPFVFEVGDHNGTAISKYRFNFDRNLSRPVDPFEFRVGDINVTDTDNVDGEITLNESANYFYARSHAPRYRIAGNNGNATHYYEVYASTPTNPQLTTLLGGIPIRSVDSVQWFQNTLHSATDGNITITLQRPPSTFVTETAGYPTTSVTAIPYTYTVNPATGGPGYPYKATILVNTNNWLIFNKYLPTATTNDFEIEFYGTGSWTGVDQSAVSSGDNAASNTNRRIQW